MQSTDVSIVEGSNHSQYFHRKDRCRVCQSTDLHPYLDLGSMPLVNRYLSHEDIDNVEPRFPLVINFCKNCCCSQLSIVVDPGFMFRSYFYRSSISQTFVNHCLSRAKEMVERLKLNPNSLVVDIASNDGAALSTYQSLGIKVQGVDPAINLADIANAKGIPTRPDFWSARIAREIRSEVGEADVITASNVFAHVDDLYEFMEGVANLLKEDGLFVVEVPYAVPFITKNEFDTTYHEHLSYFLLKPLMHLFGRSGFKVVDVEFYEIHGGTIRVYVAHERSNKIEVSSDTVYHFLNKESELGLHSLEAYNNFRHQAEKVKLDLMTLVEKLNTEGKTVVAYGASAKGNILTNYCKFDVSDILAILDDTPEKQGCFSPGHKIPILSPAELPNLKPDYLLLLAWNFAEELVKKTSDFKQNGGKYILPIPEVTIL